MSSYDKCIPTDEERWIGTVYDVQASRVIATMPEAAAPVRHHHGTGVQAGEVGEHVFIPVDRGYVFGRISRVWLETGERLYADGRTAPREVHPMAEIQLLSDVDQATLAPSGAVARPPRVGAAVYSAHPDALAQVLNMAGRGTGKAARSGKRYPGVRLGRVPGMHDSEELEIAPEALFARHCAVLGQTGGGKSWTLARLIESCRRIGGRTLLLDPSGEYRPQDKGSSLATSDFTYRLMGPKIDDRDNGKAVTLAFAALTEADLFALLAPGQGSQAPTLRNAMISLRLVEAVLASQDSQQLTVLNTYLRNGNLHKSGQLREPFDSLLASNPVVMSPRAPFDMSKLALQLDLECIYPTGQYRDSDKFGGTQDNTRAWCSSLIARINDIVTAGHFATVPNESAGLLENMGEWLRVSGSEPDSILCRVSLANVPFERDIRPVVVNSIGRWLLEIARRPEDSRISRDNPLVVFLDEAHQFMGKTVGDDFYKQRLEAFEVIAREGRKYGLLLCLATQRPRDLQEAVLSQVGALIVHRMGHPEDRQVVTQAMRDAERGAGAFLSTLGQGQAIVVGAGLPVPIPVAIAQPDAKPDSLDPDLSGIWAEQLKTTREKQDAIRQQDPEPASLDGSADDRISKEAHDGQSTQES